MGRRERRAHYLVFTFEAVTAAIFFWFCIDNMLLADRLRREIMVAPEELTPDRRHDVDLRSRETRRRARPQARGTARATSLPR